MRGRVASLTAGAWLLCATASLFAQAGTWQSLAPLKTGRQEIAAAVLDGKIYVTGGLRGDEPATDAVEAYNPNTNSWAPVAPLPYANHHHGAAVAGGKLYNFGGVSTEAFVYDATANSWSRVASLQFQHGNTPAVGVIDGKIYVAGGTHGQTTLKALEVYDPATNTWATRNDMGVARNHCAGAVIGGKFYVVGGRGSGSAPTALEVYDPQSNSWSRRANMPTGRSGIAAAAVGGELWVFGGETAQVRPEVEAYNPATNSWRRVGDMPLPRHGIWAAVIGNRIFLPAGSIVPNYGSTGQHDAFIVDRKATLANISSRLKVETGDNVLIAGFIVTGAAPKRMVVRAIGPSLAVEGALADPELALFNSDGELVAANNNWRDAPNREHIIETTLAPPNDAEAAILTTLPPGNHTAVVRGTNGTTGVGLVEVYDMEAGSESKPANISTRGFVQTGDNVLIGGLILTGSDPTRVVLRAIGPSLQVANPLGNPTLELRGANGDLVAANDDWRSSQQDEIAATQLAPANDLEAAILRTLPASTYTAIVRGAGETSGVGLVEAYSLD